MKIGIIAAMTEELQAILKYVDFINTKKIFNIEFLEGKIKNQDVVLVESGIGKVNAARTTQILIDNYNVDCVINIGVAGAISNNLQIGDVVIGKYLVQHDFDITAFGHDLGYITGVGKEIYSNEYLVNLFKNVLDNTSVKGMLGVIASGDIFCNSKELSLKIQEKFLADCVEMEGAAIAQVCFLSNIPFIVLRSISDVVNGANEVDFDDFLKSSSEIIASILKKGIEIINSGR